MSTTDAVWDHFSRGLAMVVKIENENHFLKYAASQNQGKLSGPLRDSLLSNNSKPPSKLNYETDGFIVKNEFFQISSLSILITSFIAIFQSYGFLNEEDHDQNFTVLEKLFTGQSLEGINRIKWHDQSDDSRKTGNDTWKQLYYIFYQLYIFEIIFFDTTPGTKISISYRLLNAFCSSTRPQTNMYSEIDDNPLGKYLSVFEKKDSQGRLIIEPPNRQHPSFELAVKSLISIYGRVLNLKKP